MTLDWRLVITGGITGALSGAAVAGIGEMLRRVKRWEDDRRATNRVLADLLELYRLARGTMLAHWHSASVGLSAIDPIVDAMTESPKEALAERRRRYSTNLDSLAEHRPFLAARLRDRDRILELLPVFGGTGNKARDAAMCAIREPIWRAVLDILETLILETARVSWSRRWWSRTRVAHELVRLDAGLKTSSDDILKLARDHLVTQHPQIVAEISGFADMPLEQAFTKLAERLPPDLASELPAVLTPPKAASKSASS